MLSLKLKRLRYLKNIYIAGYISIRGGGSEGGGLSILAEIAIRSKVRIKDKYAFIILIVTFRDECAGQP